MQAGGSSDSGPFKPPSVGSTNDVVEASGTAIPGEIVSTTDRTTAVNRMFSVGLYLAGLGSNRHMVALMEVEV